MLGALTHRRTTRTLLLAAFVHQLGACACGCLEHNAWVQAALSLSAETSEDHHHPAPADAPRPAAERSHCDEPGDLMYLAGRSSEEFGLQLATHTATTVDAAVDLPGAVAAAASPAEPPLLTTPGARARLQVLRL